MGELCVSVLQEKQSETSCSIFTCFLNSYIWVNNSYGSDRSSRETENGENLISS